jgi:hypothetical protein
VAEGKDKSQTYMALNHKALDETNTRRRSFFLFLET